MSSFALPDPVTASPRSSLSERARLSTREALSPLERLTPWMQFTLVLVSTTIVGVAAAFGPLYGVGSLVVVAAAIIGLRWPSFVGLTMVAVVPVLPGLHRGLVVPGLKLSEALIVGAAAVVLLPASRQRSLRWRTVDWLLFAYVAGTLVLGVFALQRRGGTLGSLDADKMFGPVQYLLLYRTAIVALNTSKLRRLAVRWMLLSSIPASLLAILQGLNMFGLRRTMADLTDTLLLSWRTPRSIGPFAGWVTMAGYEMVIILLIVALMLSPAQRTLPRWLCYVVVVPALAGLAFTQTLAVMGATAVGSLTIAFLSGRVSKTVVIRVAIGVVVAVVLASPLLESRLDEQYQGQRPSTEGGITGMLPNTVQYRLEIWQNQYIPALAPRLAFGYGPGVPPEVSWRHTESQYITLLLRGGLPLLAIAVALWIAMAERAKRAMHLDDPDIEPVGRMVFVLMGLLFVVQITAPYFTDTGLIHCLWGLMAILRRDTMSPEDRTVGHGEVFTDVPNQKLTV